MSKGAEFGIIVNDEHRFGVWRTERRLPPGWRFTGLTGTAEEMVAALRQQFVETTIAATDLTPEERFKATVWAETLVDVAVLPGDYPAGFSLLWR